MLNQSPIPRSYLFLATAMLLFTGCASITNPVANGVPAHLLPDELLAEPREELRQIPPSWLQSQPELPYRLDTGDILGVYIEGYLGNPNQLPPINFPDVGDVPPSFGYPFPVREDGTVTLTEVNSINVRGMTVKEAEEAITKAYTEDKQLIQKGKVPIIVTLVLPRRARILVVREDSPNTRINIEDPGFRLVTSASLIRNRTQGTGNELELPSNHADVLRALVRTGGLPGPSAANEIIVYRGYESIPGKDDQLAWSHERTTTKPKRQTIRIPLRLPPNASKPFSEDDVKLQSGDIVFVPASESDVYYTGGLMPARQVPLPRDYDLRVVEAVLAVGGPILSGGQLTNNFNGINQINGLGRPNPSLLTVLRKTPRGGQVNIRVDLNRALRDPRENIVVKEGDVLLLQETPSEAVSRYFAQQLGFNVFTNVFTRGSAAATASASGP